MHKGKCRANLEVAVLWESPQLPDFYSSEMRSLHQTHTLASSSPVQLDDFTKFEVQNKELLN